MGRKTYKFSRLTKWTQHLYHLYTMCKGTCDSIFTTQMIQSESTVLTDNNTFDVYALSLVGRYPHCL